MSDPHAVHLVPPAVTAQPAPSRAWELNAYRDRTRALLRRYFRLSLALGRLPSLLGGEMFRARVTAYRAASFEDLVIFVHDVERCLDRLSRCSRQMIAAIVFQEYTEREIAAINSCTPRTVYRWYCEALDETSEWLLRLRVLEPFNSAGYDLAREGVRIPSSSPRPAAPVSELPPKKPCTSADADVAPGVPRPRTGRR